MPQTWLANPLVEKLFLVLAGALVGFFSSYVLDRIKAKREPHRRISWDAAIQRALIEVSEDIKSKVRFMYGNVEVTAPTHIRCTITNTGNRVVKDHELRFPFPEDVRLLEHYLDPRPEPELGVEEIPDSTPNQCRYRIGQLERDEAVTFNFVTAGGNLGEWQPRSRNKEGDVAFQRRDVSGIKDDQEHLLPFITLLLLLVAVPPTLGFLDFAIGGVTRFAISVGLLAVLLPHIRPVVRLAERLLTRSYVKSAQTSNEVHGGGGGLIFQAGTIHDLRVSRGDDGKPKTVRVDEQEFKVSDKEKHS